MHISDYWEKKGSLKPQNTRFSMQTIIKARLEKDYGVLYTGASGRVAHELIFDLRTLKTKSGITEEDVAKTPN